MLSEYPESRNKDTQDVLKISSNVKVDLNQESIKSEQNLEENETNSIKEEVIQKLSSITEEIERRLSNTDHGLVEKVEPKIEISTPPLLKNHISLRGNLKIEEEKNIFDIVKQDIDSTTVLTSWEGKWGMNDLAFTTPNGILSPFTYTLYKPASLLDVGSEDYCNLVLKGSFKVQSALKVKAGGDPYIEVKENEVVLKISKENENSTKASVTGTGKNKYGNFKLLGEYYLQTNELNCYREYVKAPAKPKGRKMKRKSSSPGMRNVKKSKPAQINIGKREVKKPSLFENTAAKNKNRKLGTIDDFQALRVIVEKLIASDREMFFSQPVDPVKLQCPDYFDVIKKPMDLGTVRTNLDNGVYTNFSEVVEDIHQVFENAKLYNPPRHAVHKMATRHQKHFEKDLKKHERDKKKLEDQKAKKKLQKQRQRAKPTSMKPKMLELSKQRKKLMMDMFHSSDEEDSASDSDNILSKPRSKDQKPSKKKKKSKKESSAEYAMMKRTLEMMNTQMEMMTQMHHTSLEEINYLKKELLEAKAQTPRYQAPVQYALPRSLGTKPLTQSKRKKEPKQVTMQEKRNLSKNIYNLDANDQAGLLALLQELGADLAAEGEEVELDIERLSDEMLREAQKFVDSKLKKMRKNTPATDLVFDNS